MRIWKCFRITEEIRIGGKKKNLKISWRQFGNMFRKRGIIWKIIWEKEERFWNI